MLQRMNFRQLRAGGQHLAEPGIVLHGAGAEEADPHHAERLLAQMEVMPLDLELGHLGQRRAVLAAHRGGDQVLGVTDRVDDLWFRLGEHLAAGAGPA